MTHGQPGIPQAGRGARGQGGNVEHGNETPQTQEDKSAECWHEWHAWLEVDNNGEGTKYVECHACGKRDNIEIVSMNFAAEFRGRRHRVYWHPQDD